MNGRSTIAIWIVLLALSLLGCAGVAERDFTPAGQAVGTAPGTFIKLSAGFTHYELNGPPEAQTVVLIHGFSAPYYVWDPTVEALLNAGFRTLRYDVFGRGWSDRPKVNYDLELYIGQLEQLLDKLDIQDPVDICALSMGGPIAASYVSRLPIRVRRVCLFAPQAVRFEKKDIVPLNVPVIGELLMGIYVAPFMIPRTQIEDFKYPENYPDWIKRFRAPMKVPGFSRAMLSSSRNLPEIDPIALYKGLAAAGHNVLLVWGRSDQAFTLEDMEAVVETIPEIEFHIIKDAAHLAHYERANTVNPILLEFLSRE